MNSKHLDYRVRLLPQQLDRARRRVISLEREAARLGMRWLLLQEEVTEAMKEKGERI